MTLPYLYLSHYLLLCEALLLHHYYIIRERKRNDIPTILAWSPRAEREMLMRQFNVCNKKKSYSRMYSRVRYDKDRKKKEDFTRASESGAHLGRGIIISGETQSFEFCYPVRICMKQMISNNDVTDLCDSNFSEATVL